MAKKVNGYIKLQVPAGAGEPEPAGRSRRWVSRASTSWSSASSSTRRRRSLEKNLPTPVMITVYSDRSFTFIIKTPPASVLIRKAIGIEKGSGTPNTNKVGKITRKQLEDIAKIKQPDLTAADLEAAVHTIAGTARSAWALTWRACDMAIVAKRVERPGRSKIHPGKPYSIDEALGLVQEFATAKFNETVDVP